MKNVTLMFVAWFSNHFHLPMQRTKPNNYALSWNDDH